LSLKLIGGKYLRDGHTRRNLAAGNAEQDVQCGGSLNSFREWPALGCTPTAGLKYNFDSVSARYSGKHHTVRFEHKKLA